MSSEEVFWGILFGVIYTILALYDRLIFDRLPAGWADLLFFSVQCSLVFGIGQVLAFVGMVYLQMLLVFGVSSAVFDMPLGDSPVGLLVLTLALSLAATGLGLLLGSLARTAKQAGIIGMLLGFVLILASGILGLAPSFIGGQADLGLPTEGLQFYISQLTPHIHALDGYVKLLLEGAGVVDLLPNILALLGFGVVFFLIGVWRFKYD